MAIKLSLINNPHFTSHQHNKRVTDFGDGKLTYKIKSFDPEEFFRIKSVDPDLEVVFYYKTPAKGNL